MWLRDSLPYDLTCDDTNFNNSLAARVMIYGYESKVADSDCYEDLNDLATAFYSSLLALTHTSNPKPIILLAHSLGGLIVKQVGYVHNSYVLSLQTLTGCIDPVDAVEVKE